MDYEIRHYPEKKLFETVIDGQTASVEYRIEDGMLDITHTQVPETISGRGVASALVKAAYNYGFMNGLRPTATCPYAIKWLERHPELKDIVE